MGSSHLASPPVCHPSSTSHRLPAIVQGSPVFTAGKMAAFAGLSHACLASYLPVLMYQYFCNDPLSPLLCKLHCMHAFFSCTRSRRGSSFLLPRNRAQYWRLLWLAGQQGHSYSRSVSAGDVGHIQRPARSRLSKAMMSREPGCASMSHIACCKGDTTCAHVSKLIRLWLLLAVSKRLNCNVT